METLVLIAIGSLPADSGHNLGEQHQINDERRGEEGIFADIEHADGLVTSQENFGVVLVKGTFAVTDGWHILDDNGVIRVFAFLVQNVVGSNHVVNDIGFGDLLGTELLMRAKVHSVVVAKVVVTGNGGELDTSVDQKVNKGRLHLSLARLEVITTNECSVLLSHLDDTRNKGVLRRSVDERSILKDGGNGKYSGWRHLLMTFLDGLNNVVGGVVDARQEVGIAFSVGGPEDNHLVKGIGSLEFTRLL